MYGEEEYYYKMVDAGAKGFVLKDSDISEVREAILTVTKGGSFFLAGASLSCNTEDQAQGK
jgi:DNA-binding NarL/FixJ family response regulator